MINQTLPTSTATHTATAAATLTANPGHLQISLPQGSAHECWGSTIHCVRMIRPVSNADATYEVKIDGNAISASQQAYGISLFEDAQKLYRFEFSSYNGVVSVGARIVTPGWSATLINGPSVTLTGEDYLRVTKELFRYTLEYKLGSGEWTEAGSFIRGDIAVHYAGMHVLNKETNPATTANFDYFGVTYNPMPGIVSLLPNGDFEYGLMGWEQFTPQHLTAEAVSGDYAVHITEQNLVMGVNGWFSLEQGQEYTLSFWFRWDHHTSYQWGSPRIQVINDQWGTEVMNTQSLYALCPQYQWCHLGINFIASRERVRLEVGHYGPENEVDIYYDGLAIDKAGGQGEPTLTPTVTQTSTQTITPTVTPTQSTTTVTPTATQTATPTVTATPAVTATQPPGQAASVVAYTYDGSGSLVKSEVDGVITYYAGRHYHLIVEGTDETVKKYYAIGMQQIAVRTIEGASDTLNWILTDHLSSASVIANADGTLVSEVKYSAFGEIRYQSGSLPTKYQFTGQLSQMEEIGLYHYGARFYDPALSHFISADTIVPSARNVRDFNRYAYVRYNPLVYVDPSGNICTNVGNNMVCTDDNDFTVVNRPSFIDTPPKTQPSELNSYGQQAFESMVIFYEIGRSQGLILTSNDFLASVPVSEYIGAIGAVADMNAAVARRYRQHCSDGAYSTNCFNGFWGYMEMFINGQIGKFMEFVIVQPTPLHKSNWKHGKSIANAIENPGLKNDYGIISSMNSCSGFRCEWVTIGSTHPLYADIRDGKLQGYKTYPTIDGYTLLLNMEELITLCGGERCNLARK